MNSPGCGTEAAVVLEVRRPYQGTTEQNGDRAMSTHPVNVAWLARLTALLAAELFAPAAVAQGTYRPASCSYSDVNDCINGSGANTCKAQGSSTGATHTAVDGDTIILPPGSCTWTQTLNVRGAITLTGSGTASSSPSAFGAATPTTIITDRASGALISVSGLTPGQFVRISLLDLEPGGSVGFPIAISGTCSTSGCALFRLDNIVWGKGNEWTYPGTADTLVSTDNVFGVIDHNTVPSPSSTSHNTAEFVNINHTSWQGIGNAGDASLASPSTFGTDQAVYLENNSFFMEAYPITENEFPLSTYPGAGGSRITARFNHITDFNGMGVFGYHGSETSGRSRTGRQMEVYGNAIDCVGSTGCNTIAGVRGGVEYMFGNTLVLQSGQWVNTFGSLSTQRTYRNTAWYLCNGLNPYDDNDGYAQVWTGTLGSLAGGPNIYTIMVSGTPWSPGAFDFSASNPGPRYYVVFDSTIGWIAGIASNTSNTLTTSFLQSAGAGSGVTYAVPGDVITVYSTTLYAAGTHTGASQTSAVLTDDKKNWVANQWAPSNGHVYSVTNLTLTGSQAIPPISGDITTGQFSWQIASSTSDTATQNVQPYPYWEWNNGDVYIITGTTRCFDQGSAYGGQLFNATPLDTGTIPPANPVAATTESSDPSYEFRDVGSVLHGSFGTDSLNVIANRDYFTDGGNSAEWVTPGTALTTGVAWGTLANRPVSCTPGVGYWAYDQGTWNQSGNGFGQGVLYTCGSGNTWVSHYIPYSYPHPLTVGPKAGPSEPTGLTVSVH